MPVELLVLVQCSFILRLLKRNIKFCVLRVYLVLRSGRFYCGTRAAIACPQMHCRRIRVCRRCFM